jgi:hypothetical protein
MSEEIEATEEGQPETADIPSNETQIDTSRVSALASTMQAWSEMCTRMERKEIVDALKWYLRGRAEAHAMDAERARQYKDPSVTIPPNGSTDMVTQAYKGALAFLATMASSKED